MLFFILLGLGIISCVVFNYLRVKEGAIKALLVKGFTSVLFVSCGAVAAAGNLDSENIMFALFVIVGLVFGLMGDIWLDLKWMCPDDNETYTFAGFGAFMIGHLVYISGLLTFYADFSKPLHIVVPAVLAAVMAAVVILLEKPQKLNYGRFKAITAVYGFVLIFMTLLSGSLAFMNGFDNMVLNFMFAGGVFFLISDLILSGTYFGEGKNRPVDIVTNHATYYIAQFLIASSLLFI
ncbi:MAG: hypothetical protein IJZ35_07405 [Clostridia bacterium]|nr:hypothetical protein [Clostridia bacterium]